MFELALEKYRDQSGDVLGKWWDNVAKALAQIWEGTSEGVRAIRKIPGVVRRNPGVYAYVCIMYDYVWCMCTCVCVYMCMCVCVYVCMCVCEYVNICEYVNVCMYVCICICIYT